jgi:hypothetical protein
MYFDRTAGIRGISTSLPAIMGFLGFFSPHLDLCNPAQVVLTQSLVTNNVTC